MFKITTFFNSSYSLKNAFVLGVGRSQVVE